MKKLLPLLAFAFCLNGKGQCSLTVIPSYTICEGYSIILIASGTSTYSWSANAGSATTSSISVSPTITTVYTVTGTTGTCVTTPATVTVAVIATPTITISAPDTTCTFALNQTLAASGAQTYTWGQGVFIGAGDTGSIFNDYFAYGAFNFQPGMHTYTVMGTDTHGCKDSASHTIIFYQPTVTITSSPIGTIVSYNTYTVCNGDTLIAHGAHTYTWYQPSSASTSTLIVNYSAGYHTAFLVGFGNLGCTDTVNFTLMVDNCSTGISQTSSRNSNFSIYPNPATTSLQVLLAGNSEGSAILITDIIGNTVKQLMINSKELAIEVADLAEGVYNVSIITNEGTINKKVVIVK